MESKSALRASVGFPPELYGLLKRWRSRRWFLWHGLFEKLPKNTSRINGRFFKGRGKGDADIL